MNGILMELQTHGLSVDEYGHLCIVRSVHARGPHPTKPAWSPPWHPEDIPTVLTLKVHTFRCPRRHSSVTDIAYSF